MPRSYNFDYFKAPKRHAPVSRKLAARDKQRVVESQSPALEELPGGNGKIHYGQEHAETKEILAQRAKHREDLAAPEVEPESWQKRTPIGAMPVTSEITPPTLFRELFDIAGRNVRTMRSAAWEMVRAGRRLLGLPWTAATLARRRLTGAGRA